MRLLLLFLPRLFVGSLARFSPVETSGDLLRQGRRWSEGGGDSRGLSARISGSALRWHR